VSVTAAVPVHVDMDPPVDQPEEQNMIAEMTRAIGIIDRLKTTSPLITGMSRRLRACIDECERSAVREFEVALYQGGVPPGMVPGLASLLARSTVSDIQMVLAKRGDSIVVYFLCKTVEAFSKLGQMITSGFMHTVFTVVIQTTAARTTVEVYVRQDEFNLRLLCLTTPQDKGQPLFRHTHLTSDTCVTPHHNTKVDHSSDSHTLHLRLFCLTSPQHKGFSPDSPKPDSPKRVSPQPDSPKPVSPKR